MSTLSQASILAIDTSTNFLSLALRHQNQTILWHKQVDNKQSEWILPTVQSLLQQADVAVSELDYIVYAQGPGAFTGLRIGLGVAQGLAIAFHTPLIGIPSLDAVAALAPKHQTVLAATDARMNELFYAWYNTSAAYPQLLTPYQVAQPHDIQLPENQQHGIGVGNAFDLNISLPVEGENCMPTAEHYLNLALSNHYAATPAPLAKLIYVRNKIALTTTEQAHLKAISC